MSNKRDLDTANKLLMLQGISLIYDGLEFLNWMTDDKDTTTLDALSILRDRFHFFRDCALADGKLDHFIIDKTTNLMENVQHGYEARKEVNQKLNDIRSIAVAENLKK